MLNAGWDGRPADYAATRDCWLTERRRLYVSDALSRAPSGARILELGSGVGELLVALASARPDLTFVGTEPQQSYVDWARREASVRSLGNLTFERSLAGDVAATFSKSPLFDWILSNDMLHHVDSEGAVLAATAAIARPGARWLVIEPNWINPYVLIGCAIKRGERNFWPGPFLAGAPAHGWSMTRRDYLFLIPPFVRRAPSWLVRLERAFERYPPIAGGVAITLVRSG